MNKTKYESPQMWEIDTMTDSLLQAASVSVSKESFDNEDDFTFASRKQQDVWTEESVTEEEEY